MLNDRHHQGDQSYVVRREFTAVDACGNFGRQTITVSDTEPLFVGDLPSGMAEFPPCLQPTC